MLKQVWRQCFISACIVLAVSMMTACGGGSSPTPDPIKTALSGQVQQDPGAAIASPAGAPIRGASVSLLSGTDVIVTETTDNQGNFSFDDVEAGNFTMELEVASNVDLDDDNDNDVLIINMPITIIADSIVVFNTTISGVDINIDGDLDSVDILSRLTDNKGRDIKRLIRLLHRLGKVQIDEDSDGDLGEEEPEDDADVDGIPDDAQGNLNSLHGGVLRGPIEAIDDDSLTVRGIEFAITGDTMWKARGNKDAGLDDFSFGDNVLIHARWDGDNWIALSIKQTGQGTGGPGPVSADFSGVIELLTSSEITIDDRTIDLDGSTEWSVEGIADADASDFDPGDFVMIEAVFADGVWVATRITMIQDDDDDTDPVIETFTGLIAALSATSTTVGTQVISLDGETSWTAEDGTVAVPGDFAIGDEVSVEARQEGLIWVAIEVTMISDNDPVTDTFAGLIESISATELMLHGDLNFVIDSETHFMFEDGTDADPALFDASDFVTVEARQEGAVWVAMHVTLITDETVIESFSDILEVISATELTIHGDRTFVIDELTHFMFPDGSDADPALFDAGDFVTVQARQSGESWIAMHITLVQDETIIQHFFGAVDTKVEGTLTVTGQAFITNEETHWMLPDGSTLDHALFDAGDLVEVEARKQGTEWVALHVSLHDDNDTDPVLQFIEGPIVLISALSLTVGAQMFTFDVETNWFLLDGTEGDYLDFAIDDNVRVLAEQDGLNWTALTVNMTE